jgi:hypothetical protein
VPDRILGFEILVKRADMCVSFVLTYFFIEFWLDSYADYYYITGFQCVQDHAQLHTVVFMEKSHRIHYIVFVKKSFIVSVLTISWKEWLFLFYKSI